MDYHMQMLFFYVFIFHGMQIAAPETCPANDLGKCGDSDEWKGEFFPGISKIKYEVDLIMEIYF